MKKINCIGQRFGRLEVLNDLPPKILPCNQYKRIVFCKCDCGKTADLRFSHLVSGLTKSCGCLQREITSKRSKTHGMVYSKEYTSWSSMIQRCLNPKNEQYINYGGRGITVCDEWLKFENFYKDMGEKPFPKAQIDRIDNNKGYYKENCRWVSSKDNNKNKRNNRVIEHQGMKKCLSEWAEILETKYNTLSSRISRGVPLKGLKRRRESEANLYFLKK